MDRLIEELKSRTLTRVALTYAAVAFAGLQGADLVLSALGAERAYRWAVLLTLAGFPLALALAWLADIRRNRRVPRAEGTAEVGGHPRSPHRRLPRRHAAALVVLVAAGSGLYGYRAWAHQGTVPPDAEVVAVAPFVAVGGAEVALGEGIAQLLATNLDQVGGLRTVDPARVLRAWRSGDTGPAPEEESLEIGRKLGAGSVLMGDLVAVGGEVRLTARLQGVNGPEMARAQVTGPAADVLLLADSLSNRLLREIWRSSSPVPQLRVAAITTGNLEAIRAYLAGERYYRALQWDSAISAFQRAVEADSTFALAYRRLADSYGWKAPDSPLRARYEAAAARRPERLPERERRLAVAYLLWHERSEYAAAVDTLNAHLASYPDDADALDLKAEVLYHGTRAGVLAEEDSTLLASFEAALDVNPSLTPAMIHPFELTLATGDSSRFRQYATRLFQARLGPEAAVAPLIDSVVGLYWKGEAYPALMRRLSVAPEFAGLGYPPVWLLIRAGRDPHPALDAMLASGLDDSPEWELYVLASGLVLTGRLSEAGPVLDRLARQSPIQEWTLRATAVGFGSAGPDFLPDAWPRPPLPMPEELTPVWWAPSEAVIALSQGDTASARALLRVALAASHSLPPAVDALRRFQVGRLMVERGHVAAGIDSMELALAAAEAAPSVNVVPPAGFHKFFLAIAHSEHPATRDRGIAEIRGLLGSVAPWEVALRLHLARALEARGERNEAREEYAVVVTLAERAEGPLSRLREEAQAALARLTREG